MNVIRVYDVPATISEDATEFAHADIREDGTVLCRVFVCDNGCEYPFEAMTPTARETDFPFLPEDALDEYNLLTLETFEKMAHPFMSTVEEYEQIGLTLVK